MIKALFIISNKKEVLIMSIPDGNMVKGQMWRLVQDFNFISTPIDSEEFRSTLSDDVALIENGERVTGRDEVIADLAKKNMDLIRLSTTREMRTEILNGERIFKCIFITDRSDSDSATKVSILFRFTHSDKPLISLMEYKKEQIDSQFPIPSSIYKHISTLWQNVQMYHTSYKGNWELMGDALTDDFVFESPVFEGECGIRKTVETKKIVGREKIIKYHRDGYRKQNPNYATPDYVKTFIYIDGEGKPKIKHNYVSPWPSPEYLTKNRMDFSFNQDGKYLITRIDYDRETT